MDTPGWFLSLYFLRLSEFDGFRVIYAVLKDDTLESEGFILDAGHQFLLLFAAVMSLLKIAIFPSWIQSLLL